jgi:DNA-binding response OmpR family regulator
MPARRRHLADRAAPPWEAEDGLAAGQAYAANGHALPTRPSVLVVDDECPLLKLMIEELESAGYGVMWAATGEDAIWLMQAAHPAALVTDTRLAGDLTGWDVAQRFRQLRPSAPVLYTSGHSDLLERPVTTSMFVRKPYRPAEVIGKIQRLIGPARSCRDDLATPGLGDG